MPTTVQHEVWLKVISDNSIMVVCSCGYVYTTADAVEWTAMKQIVTDHLEAQ